MLAELEIENFAIVEKVSFSFHHGLNVLTGETGAGKSLIMESLNYLLGGTLRDKPLRAGAESGYVTARFVDISPEVRGLLEQWGCLDDDNLNEVVLSRELRSSGRSVTRLNGRLVALANLRELGVMLVDFHGQHQQYELTRPAVHLAMLDHLAGPEHEARVKRFGELFARNARIERELEGIRQGERMRLREIDWTAHEIEEIDKVHPQAGEDVELEERIKVLAAAEELSEGCGRVMGYLRNEGGVCERLGEAGNILRKMSGRDKRLETLWQRVQELAITASDCALEIEGYSEGISSDPGELDELQARSEALRKLQRKYGPSLEEVIAYRAKAQRQMENLLNCGERCDSLQSEQQKLRAEMDALARQISARRCEEAETMSRLVESELTKVGMEASRLQVVCQTGEGYNAEGADKVEFLFCPNPGEPYKPLAKVASGGELSRVMLALTVIFSRFNRVRTVVYDEIDAGLGGVAGHNVAARLQELASRAQVLCVTHLAVLAASGAHHYHMRKGLVAGRTVTTPAYLTGLERELEIARMLSGDSVPDSARQHARDLLNEATEVRQRLVAENAEICQSQVA